MNQLNFSRREQTFSIFDDGKAVVTSASGELAGNWSADSAEQNNQLTIRLPGLDAIVVDARYSFVTNTEWRLRNILQVSVAADEADGQPATAFFTGRIVIDDRKDIEYRLASGRSFFIYGELAFASGYSELVLITSEGAQTAIQGRVGTGSLATPVVDERDLLIFSAFSQWLDENGMPQETRADIRLRGAFEPRDGTIVFHGKFENEDTFTIALAGKYKVVAGALEIYSHEEGLSADLRLTGTLNFYGTTGRWGLVLGQSGRELDMQAAISFDRPITSKDGDVTIKGDAAVGLAGESFRAELDLDVQAQIDDTGILAFNLKAGVVNGQTRLYLKGSFIGKGDSRLLFELGYADNRIRLELGYESDRLKARIRLITDGASIAGWFSVTITFGADDQIVKGSPIAIASPADTDRSPAVEAPAAPTPVAIDTSPAITPRSLPTYPRVGPGLSNDFDRLHPVLRKKVIALQTRIFGEGIPLYVFEGVRSPDRQNELYTRTPRVTHARAWQSYHQYGVAVDFVFHESQHGGWHWGRNDQHKAWYGRLHECARDLELERLSWETPHLQLAGVELDDLQKGRFPAGRDAMWGDHLTDTIRRWQASGNTPEAPALPQGWTPTDRPALDVLAERQPPADGDRRRLSKDDLDGAAGFHSRYGGTEWKVEVTGSRRGVFIKGSGKPERTSGEPVTCRKIVALYQDYISQYALTYGVPEELIIMTIATESSAYRQAAYTGPATFRWEDHIGEYSAGPMQVLSSTARELIDRYDLALDAEAVAPRFSVKPSTAPVQHGLYDPRTNIQLGTVAIKHRMSLSGCDPVLVAAAYNSGGLYHSSQNRWHLRSHGDHLDRAARWFGDVYAI